MDCSIWTQKKWDALVARLGPDPLNGDGEEKFFERVRKSRKSIGELLMDQTAIAGVGNILRAEMLYRSRQSPFVAGNKVEEPRLESIWKDAEPLLRAAMVDRRIVTTRPEDRPHGKGPVLKEETHYVYRRNGLPCFVCGTVVKKQEMAGRNLFWCPKCQAE
jgi:endonuclease-8